MINIVYLTFAIFKVKQVFNYSDVIFLSQNPVTRIFRTCLSLSFSYKVLLTAIQPEFNIEFQPANP